MILSSINGCGCVTLRYVIVEANVYEESILTGAVIGDNEPGYNDTGVYDTSLIKSDILWYQLIPNC